MLYEIICKINKFLNVILKKIGKLKSLEKKCEQRAAFKYEDSGVWYINGLKAYYEILFAQLFSEKNNSDRIQVQG